MESSSSILFLITSGELVQSNRCLMLDSTFVNNIELTNLLVRNLDTRLIGSLDSIVASFHDEPYKQVGHARARYSSFV